MSDTARMGRVLVWVGHATLALGLATCLWSIGHPGHAGIARISGVLLVLAAFIAYGVGYVLKRAARGDIDRNGH